MSNPWFRFYSAAIRHPKVATLSDSDFRLWVKLLAVACENNGFIPPLDTLKKVLKTRLDHLLQGLNRLVSALLIEVLEVGYTPHNWNKKQFISDTSTPRVTLHRQRRETAPEQNRTDSEEKKDTTYLSKERKFNGKPRQNTFANGLALVEQYVDNLKAEADREADAGTEAGLLTQDGFKDPSLLS
jgi:hypothetical protein